MAISLNSYLGKVHSLASNPRVIRDSAFNKLVESVERDPEFLRTRGIVVWQVPAMLSVAADEKSPFRGQEGKLVVLGGNQRLMALKALGMSEIKREWLVEAKDESGNWISEEKAARFVLLDNNPEGISGDHDYEKMLASFSQMSMSLAGIDFSSFEGMMTETAVANTEMPEDVAEKGEHGEKSEELKTFIEHREQTRKDLKEIDDTGFHLLVVFDSFEEKADFISRSGLTGERKAIKVDGGVYLDLVFESYDQKMQFVREAGLVTDEETMGEGKAEVVYDLFCDGRALARKMGIELKESGLHFRDRKVDSQLAEMTQDEKPQRTEREIEEEIHKAAKRSAKRGIKAKKR